MYKVLRGGGGGGEGDITELAKSQSFWGSFVGVMPP